MARQVTTTYVCDGCGNTMDRPERIVTVLVDGPEDDLTDDLCGTCGPKVESTIASVKKSNGQPARRGPRQRAVPGQDGNPPDHAQLASERPADDPAPSIKPPPTEENP